MTDPQQNFLVQRRRMVQEQLRARDIRSPAILDAFAAVPRELFVPPAERPNAYCDRPISIGMGQTISQPYVVALMVQELELRLEHRVLDVGAGSGYQTAILAGLAGHVYAVERLEPLGESAAAVLGALNVANVTMCTADGSLGWPEEAPFDRIISGAAAPDIPDAWIGQLADEGRIVAPIGKPNCQQIVVLSRRGEQLSRREVCGVRFVPLIGRQGWPD